MEPNPVAPKEFGASGPQDPATIFLSYSSKDIGAAREFQAFLESHGYRAWMAPDSLQGSASWVEQILSALKDCQAMVVVLSQHAVASTHIPREVSIALDAGKPVIPVRLAPVELSGSLNYLLHLVQWVDVFPPPVHQHADRLLQRLDGARLQRGAPQPVHAPRSRPRRSLVWVAAAVLVAVIAAVAIFAVVRGGSNTSNGSPGDPLAAVPKDVTRLGDLGTHLAKIAEHDKLPAGDDVRLLDTANVSKSISVRRPSTWTDVNLGGPLLDDADKPTGDLLVAAVDISRQAKFSIGGIFVGAALPNRMPGKSLSEAFPDGQFINRGCIASPVVHVRLPIPGEVRVWGSCAAKTVIVIGYLRDAAWAAGFVAVATTRAEGNALGQVLNSLAINAKSLHYG